MVERLEPRHHRFADAGAGDFVALRFQAALNSGDQLVDLVGGDVALAGRMADRAGKLVAVERLALAVLLDDGEVAQLHPFERGETLAAGVALPAPTDRGSVLARPAVLNLAVLVRAERAAHLLSLVDREARAQLADLLVHRALDFAVVVDAVGREAVEDVGDHVADGAELGLAEATSRARGRADPDSAGLDRRQRVER